MLVCEKPFERLYVHVPFCGAKCDYCAFHSTPRPDRVLVRAYLDRLGRELAEVSARSGKLRSVFVGGGTPSHLDCESLSELFGMIEGGFDIEPDAERSVECNPESLDSEKAALLRGRCNRASVGIQSFDPELRRTLGRAGDPEKALEAVGLLRGAGFDNIGADFIYGIPGQTMAAWERELETALEAGLEHISAYALTIEEGSALGRRRDLPPADEDLCADMWEAAGAILGSRGIRRYEISNHAARGRECDHNLSIWLGSTYAGCGPAAASFDGRTRASNPWDTELWLGGSGAVRDEIPDDRRAREMLAMGLRTTDGWDAETFDALALEGGVEDFGRTFKYLFDEGLAWRRNGRVGLSEAGLLVWNSVAEEIVCP